MQLAMLDFIFFNGLRHFKGLILIRRQHAN
ncbi:hypothetical protein SAMN05421882_105317 [Nitrosomonas communis]|uniref:Uncharacterized protein n=1 Tax=Nitrosomonas communis TaxID=44574 RepID=A0A1H2YLK9_9PROT|nr:hypothetical protein SAMN05421882_105317 [Nitrosomonas communis]